MFSPGNLVGNGENVPILDRGQFKGSGSIVPSPQNRHYLAQLALPRSIFGKNLFESAVANLCAGPLSVMFPMTRKKKGEK